MAAEAPLEQRDTAVEGDDDLRTRIANLERFAHRLAHELGTPLTTARGFASILLEREDLDPTVRDGLVRIERATATAEARLQARVGEAVGEGPRPVRLRAVLRDVASSMTGPARELVIDVPNPVRVFGEPSVVRLIVEHLLEVLAERASDEGDRALFRVVSLDGPIDAETLRFEADGPSFDDGERRAVEGARAAGEGGTPTTQLERLQAASGLIAGQGGKLWLDDPTSESGRLALLVQLPRAIDGPSAAGTGSAGG